MTSPPNIRRGASDICRLAPSENGDDADSEFALLREYMSNFGDRVVHFSSEVVEVVEATPSNRIVAVTEQALYKFPQSAAQTGLFYDARFPLEKLVQVVAIDNDDQLQGHGLQGLDAQVFVQSDAGSTTLAFTLNFAQFPARRQAFFLAMSLVKPGIPILLKRRVNDPDAEQQEQDQQQQQPQQQQTPGAASQRKSKSPPASSRRGGSTTPRYMTNPKANQTNRRQGSAPAGQRGGTPMTPASPVPQAPSASSAARSRGDGGKSNPINYSPAAFRDPTSGALSDEFREHRPTPEHSGADVPAAAAKNAPEPSSEEYERAKKQLHVLLMFDLSPANQLDMLDPGWRTAHRPAEESLERLSERDEIRAMIHAKEDKIELDARFREKNPKKVLTKFARGVCLEFDKAHEERFVPPELSDEMLLGPALFPLWKQWKLSGGLLKVDRGGGDDEDHPWTLFDTNDLISSIRAQEDALLGQIGKKSMIRLQQMRELVEREKKMFMNRRASHKARARATVDDDDEEGGDDLSDRSSQMRSPNQRKTTKVVPFRLSASPNLERQVKRAKPQSLDLGSVMRTMKDTLMVHRTKLHDLQKTQLVREINRHAGL